MNLKKIPRISHLEATPAELARNLQAKDVKKIEEVKEAEQAMGNVSFLEEEVRSLYDTIAEGVTYQDVVAAGILGKFDLEAIITEKTSSVDEATKTVTLAESLRANIQDDIKSKRNRRILVADVKGLMSNNRGIMALFQTLLKSYERLFTGEVEEVKASGPQVWKRKTEAPGSPDQDALNTNREAKRLAYAKLVGMKPVFLMLKNKEAELAELEKNPDGMGDVDLLRKHVRGKVREKIKKLTNVKAPIEMANVTREGALLRTNAEHAVMTGSSEGAVDDLDFVMVEAAEETLGLKAERSLEFLQARGAFEEEGNLVNSDFLSAYVNYHHELKNMYRLLEKGRIVETDYIRDLINRALPILRQNPPGVLYLHGDFGSGKTALAVHICKTKLGKSPIIVSGNKYLEPDRFTEEFRIKKADEVDFYQIMLRRYGVAETIKPGEDMVSVNAKIERAKEQIVAKIVAKRKEKDGKKLSDAEKIRTRDHIDSVFENKVEGQYVLGAMYAAMREGRPLIIDEANAITPDVLIAFNDLLTKKHGEKIQTRTHLGEITVQPGYCIIWTGNTGDRYKNQARYELDPAGFSRVEGIKVEYLPNSNESTTQAALMERITLEQGGVSIADAVFSENAAGGRDVSGLVGASSPTAYDVLKKRAKQDQIFQVLLCKLLNRRLGSMLLVKEDEPYSVFKELYKLGMVARNVMDLFEGKYKGNLIGNTNLKKMIGGNATAPELTKTLQKTNLTMRALIDRIVGRYKHEGMVMDLEYYCFRYVQGLAERPEELVILYKEFQANGFFRITEGWPNPDNFVGAQPSTASPKDNVMGFTSLISSFNPLGIAKYADVQMNGDHFSFMKVPTGNNLRTGEKLVYRYFNSMETMQLMFGLLPPRRLAEYQEMAEVLAASNQGSDLEKIEEISAKLTEIIENTTGVNGTKLLKIIYQFDKAGTSAKAGILSQIIEETRHLVELPNEKKISDLEEVKKMTMEEFEVGVNSYLDELMKLLERTQAVTQAQAAEIAEMSVEDRVQNVSGLIKGILDK